MRSLVLLGCLGLAGCDQAFGLEGRLPIDAPPMVGCWNMDFTGNEDTDTLVDGCDNCPLITNEPQLDTDLDGVGNACDPNPDDPIDEIAVFEPMRGFTTTLWSQYGAGNWETAPGGRDIKQANRGDAVDLSSVIVYEIDSIDQPTVQLKVASQVPDDDVEPTTLPPAALSVVGAYLILDATIGNSTPDGMICGMEFPTALDTPVRGWSRVETGGALEPAAFADLTGGPPSVITISANQLGKLPTDPVVPGCQIQRGDDPIAMPIGTSSVVPAGAKFGLWTNNVSATFSALFVTKRRTTPL